MILSLARADHAPGDRLADIEHSVEIGPHELAPRLGRKSSSGVRRWMPALLTSTPIGPTSCSIAGDAALHASRSVTSKTAASAGEPVALHGRDRRRDLPQIAAVDHDAGSASAKPRASARPIPRRAGDQRNDIVKREQPLNNSLISHSFPGRPVADFPGKPLNGARPRQRSPAVLSHATKRGRVHWSRTEGSDPCAPSSPMPRRT